MRGKTMFLRLFLTLLLMAGLTVDFQNIGINFGTAAHACGDDSDFFEDWDFEDFEDYVNSGESESDGIVGHVWDDSAEFFNKTSDETVDDVFDSLTELNHDDNSDSGGDDNNGSNSGSDEIPDGWGFHGTINGGMIIDDVVFTEQKEESKEPEEQPEVVNNDDDDDEDEDPGDDNEVRVGEGTLGSKVGRVYEYKESDTVLPNALETQGKQIKNSCVTATMEYVNHMFGGEINEGRYHEWYLAKYNSLVVVGGVEIDHVKSMIEANFFITEYKSLRESIDENAAVFTTINEGRHSVVVVGYSGSDYVYFDPEYGDCRIADSSEFSKYYIAVVGIK